MGQAYQTIGMLSKVLLSCLASCYWHPVKLCNPGGQFFRRLCPRAADDIQRTRIGDSLLDSILVDSDYGLPIVWQYQMGIFCKR